MAEITRRINHLSAKMADALMWAIQHRLYGLMALFLAGALLSRAQPPHDLFWASFLAFPVFLMGLDAATSPTSAFGRGWAAGFGFFITGLSWIATSFEMQTQVPADLGPFGVLGLSAGLAIYTGLCFLLTYVLRPHGWMRALTFAAIWTLIELARAHLFSGFPWALIATQWGNFLPVVQLLHYSSVYALGFITIVASALLYYWARYQHDRSGLLISLTACMVLLIAAGLGQIRLDQTPQDFQEGVNLRLVQANVQQREKWQRHLIEDHFNKHLSLSRAGNRRGKARGINLLIWPEVSVQTLDFDRSNALARYRISRLLEPGAFALVGARRIQENTGNPNDRALYNSLFATSRDGRIYGRYDKQHLVPFGEYLPFEGLLNSIGLQQLTGGRGFSAGRERNIIQLPGMPPFRTLICYESIFPGTIQPDNPQAVKPLWILNITNDSWFGDSDGPWQHLAQARMRAIEEGLPLVRVASTGISTVIDPLGRPVVALDLNREGVLDAPLPKPLSGADNISSIFSVAYRLYVSIALMLLLIAYAIYTRITKKY